MNKEDQNNSNNHKNDESIPTASYGGAAVGPGEQIGPYKLLRILGEGGYGIVYLAERQRPVKRRVALKVIKPGMDTKHVIARFEAERQALALLDHPNIAHVFNAGTTEAGRPYFAMEYVKGDPITEHCDRYKLTIEERLKLFMMICEAVQYAHQKAIIHRDIKPSNILVAYEGEKAVPMIIDFGVAKALSQSLTERTLVTEQAQMVGTPEYMSPEQAEMAGQDIDTRTDVYSLGVLLYELLTGTLPFDSQTLREGGPERMRRLIREQDPKIPSVRFSTVEREKSVSLAGLRRTDIRTLERRLHGELDWITLKAMDKDRIRRYQTAYALAEDTQRYLNQEPVLAGPPSTIYKFRKFATRNKVVLVSVATIAAIFVLSAVVSTILAIKATRAQLVAEEATKAEIHQRQKAEEAQNAAETLAKQREEDLYFNLIALAHREMLANRPAHVLDLLEQCPAHLRDWEWHYLQRNCRFQKTAAFEFDSDVLSFAFSPDGSTLAALCADGNLVLRDRNRGGKRNFQVRRGYSEEIELAKNFTWIGGQRLVYSPDGSQLAVVSDENVVKLISSSSGETTCSLSGHQGMVVWIAFNPDGTQIATAGWDRTVRLWNRHTGELEHTLYCSSRPLPLVYGRAGQWLIAGYPDDKGAVHIWDSTTGVKLRSFSESNDPAMDMAMTPDGTRFAMGTDYCRCVVWDIQTWKSFVLRGHTEAVPGIDFNPSATRLASVSHDQTVRIWDTIKGREALVIRVPGRNFINVAFSKDGHELIVGDRTRTLFTLDATKRDTTELEEPAVLLGHDNPTFMGQYNPSGTRLVTAAREGTIRLWDTATKEQISEINLEATGVWHVEFSRDGRFIVATGLEARDKGFVKVFEAIAPHRERFTYSGDEEFYVAVFDASGKYVLAGGASGTLMVWNWQSNAFIRELGEQGSTIGFIAVGSDGKFVSSTGLNGDVKIWDATQLSERQEGRVIYRRGMTWFSAEFDPNGRQVAVGGRDGEIAIIDVVSGAKTVEINNAHGDAVRQVSFDPTGRYIASASSDQTVRIWEVETGEPVDIFLGHRGNVHSVVFSPDGEHVASTGNDETVRIWTLRLK